MTLLKLCVVVVIHLKRAQLRVKTNFILMFVQVATPFYTGKQKIMDTAGRVEKFKSRYGAFKR